MFEKKPSKTTSHLSEKVVKRNVTMVTKISGSQQYGA